ncbi:dhhc zinc finger domain containing protein [Stylonychia lemnae]|uniref:Palmitoyltransferase n=1 Tax=Stylonychia lemnae TaxID=5949 RepID=A0A078A140_STYLE|nr:dhhc zinc finger domain containing protein [Stylonychia lemnae]|eukprot:CDW74494.1 dhhc zinc finger domain containing protein [Stylonychia lemnae]
MAIGLFLMYKVNYLYYLMQITKPATPDSLKSVLKKDKYLEALNNDLVKKFSYDLAETKRFSNMISYESLAKITQLQCLKCKEFKPLRTHHCSVCNQCVLLMDHHCMWTNCCIGLHNYDKFLQLNLYGMIGAMYSVLTIRLCDESTFYQTISDSGLFFTIIKVFDLLIGKFLLILFIWNVYVSFQGYTHLEFKDLIETQIKKKNQQKNRGNELESQLEDEVKGSQHNHVKFEYGYKSIRENLAWIFGTKSFLQAFLFIDRFHDQRLKYNGVEWTVIYYWNDIQDFYFKNYGRVLEEETDQMSDATSSEDILLIKQA